MNISPGRTKRFFFMLEWIGISAIAGVCVAGYEALFQNKPDIKESAARQSTHLADYAIGVNPERPAGSAEWDYTKWEDKNKDIMQDLR